MSVPLRVLIVEDSEDDCQLDLRELRRGGFEPSHLRVETEAELRAALERGPWQIVLSDYSLPGFSGQGVLQVLHRHSPELPCIIVSGAIGEDAAVNAIRDGARDYVMKDRLARLCVAVRQQLAEAEARAARRQTELEIRRRNEEVAALHAIAEATGRSLALAEVAEAALAETLRVLDAGAGALFLKSEGAAPGLVAQKGFSPAVLEEIAPLAEGAASLARIVTVAPGRPAASGDGWTTLLVIALGAPAGEAGALVAATGAVPSFSPDLLALAEGIGRQVSVAVQNAQLHEGLRSRTRHLEALQRITETMRSTLPLSSVLETIANNACRALEAIAAVILIPDPRGERLKVGVIAGSRIVTASLRLTGRTVESYQIPLTGNDHPVARVYREGRMIEWSGGLAPAIDGLEPPVNRALLSFLDLAIRSRSTFVLPLSGGSRTAGVLAVFMPTPAITAAERALLTDLADQGGLAIESARLFEEAQRLREFNQGIVEGVAEAILIQDADGLISFANPAAETLLGYPPGGLLQRRWGDLLRAGASPSAPAAGSTRRFEAELVTRGGSTVPVIVSSRPLRPDGTSAGVLSAITDITERVHAEQLITAMNRASLAMAQAMTHEEAFSAAARELRSVGCTCIVLMLSGSDLQVRFHSFTPEAEAAVRAVSIDSGPPMRVPLSAIGPDWQRYQRREAIVLTDGPALVRQLLPAAPEWDVARLAALMDLTPAIAAPMVISNEVVGVVAVTSRRLQPTDLPTVAAFANQVAAVWHKHDLLLELRGKLDELQRVQMQLVQAQKMEAIGRLAGGVAHDFNNQLTAIMGTAELLAERFADDPEARQEIDEILATANRSATLTRQLLAFSRKQTIRPVVLDPGALVKDMHHMLSRLIGEDVSLQIDAGPGRGLVRTDAGQLEQAVLNLVVNARDAMPRGGKLTIDVAAIEVSTSAAAGQPDAIPGRHLRISVADTGTGMDEGTRSHLFEPFFTTKPPGEGTGLGLATTYGFVRQAGGFIAVQTAPGAGSCFSIHLPVSERGLEEPPAERESRPAVGGTETILVVEDEAQVRSLVRTILARGGYTVLEASNGEMGESVERSAAGPVHLLLTDVVIPGALSCKAMVERIRGHRPGIRVLLTSGYPDQAIEQHGVLDPALRMLPKPFTPTQLLRAVREALEDGGQV